MELQIAHFVFFTLICFVSATLFRENMEGKNVTTTKHQRTAQTRTLDDDTTTIYPTGSHHSTHSDVDLTLEEIIKSDILGTNKKVDSLEARSKIYHIQNKNKGNHIIKNKQHHRIVKSHVTHLNKTENFTSDAKVKKAEVYVIDTSDFDENSDQDSDVESESDLSQSMVVGGNKPSGSKMVLQDVAGDRKGFINHVAEDIVLDEDSSSNDNTNDQLIAQSLASASDGNDEDQIINDSMKDGMSTQFLENNQMIRANEVQGNILPVNTEPIKSFTNQANLLQTLIDSPKIERESLFNTKSFQGPQVSDSSVTKSRPELPIDADVSAAITAEIEKDNQLAQTQSNAKPLASLKPNTGTAASNTAVGDFANIVENAVKSEETENSVVKTLKPNSIYSPVSNNVKPAEILDRVSDKINPPSVNGLDASSQQIYKQDEADTGLDVNPGLAALSPSEQRLITSIDDAVKTKDIANELATKIMMPTKEDTVSDRSVTPSEQLLDMLSKGKFEKPLPDDILNKLSTFNPNNLYLQEEGLQALHNLESTKKFRKVGQDYVPVRSVSVKMPKAQPKTAIHSPRVLHAQIMAKTDPTFLAINNQILDPAKYKTLQDLTNFGEPFLPAHVVSLNRPIIEQASQHTAPKLLTDLPPNLAKLVKEHRSKEKPIKNFEDAITDAPNHNSADRFIPEKQISIPEETTHQGEPKCKWNPCLNGGLCTAHPDRYYCNCKPGWVGENCEKRSNCFPNPCHHHGICSPNADGFTCTCRVGYKGSRCDMLDRCHPNPCNNNGLCTDSHHGVQCECPRGFKGILCEMESKCEPINPCMNGATCREFLEHYHCSCPVGFRGQNCEAYIAPTKAPPTIPIKHEGPQAIPVPDNVPANVLHEVYTHRYDDSTGKTELVSHESYGPIGETANPGVNMVPHLNSPEYHNPFDGHIVGVPTKSLDEDFVIHRADEKEPKKDKKEKEKNPTAEEISGPDDRYQTHLVETEKEETHHSPHVGKEIASTGEASYLSHHPHPEEEHGERPDQIKEGNKEVVESTKDEHLDRLKENSPKDVHDEAVPSSHHDLHLPESHGIRDDSQTVIVSGASPLNEETGTERSAVRSKNDTSYSYTLSNNQSKAKPSQVPVETIQNNVDEALHTEQMKVTNVTKAERQKANNVITNIKQQLQNASVPNSYSKQRDAYAVWRRKALTNFHNRNPSKPLPKNTLSLSKNSLCPKFCRDTCNPWCAYIGCCNISKAELEMFKAIEKKYHPKETTSKKATTKHSSTCKKCNANADCVQGTCRCKPGFHGDGHACTVDNCLLCHLDANCVNDRCMCKQGFFGDGYECRDKKLEKTLCSLCHQNADCIGGDCLCARGFYGNGKDCWPLPIIR